MRRNLMVKPIFLTHSPTKIYYGYAVIPEYGKLFLAYFFEKTPQICFAHFITEQEIDTISNYLQKLWPGLELEQKEELTKKILQNCMTEQNGTTDVDVILNGTEFQNKVWNALLEIPFGEERTYGEIAVAIGNPKAVRAVASAIGANNIALFVPCHRVKSKMGDTSKYRWGADLKARIMLNERKKICK